MKYTQSQLDLSEVSVDETVTENKRKRQRWREGMQAYINKQQQSEVAQNTGWCVCGYMDFCDYCNDTTKNTACVNALIKMCKEHDMTIDFERNDYEKQLKEYDK